MKKPKLTVIILNYNTKELLSDCLKSVKANINDVPMEVIVSDNSSTDGSQGMIRKNFPWVKLISGPNISFSNGNNRAKNIANGEYILFLNSDTLVHKNTLKKTIEYFDSNYKIGALGCKLILPNGDLDRDAKRRFPTPWVSFNRLFLNNGKKYWYEEISPNKIQEVDAIQGAFFLTKKKILDEVGWFDENFIFDGEDLDLCFQIKKAGYKIIYFGEASTTHFKKATKNKLSNINLKRKMEGVDSMEYFYRKNLWNNYPLLFNYFVLLGIKVLKLIRFIQTKLSR